MKFSEFFTGRDDKLKKKQTYTPEQMDIYNQMYKGLQGGEDEQAQGGGIQSLLKQLFGMMNPESQDYKDFEAPYLTEFNEKTLPGIGERFAGMGANSGALSSSGFGQALGGAASQYQSNMQGMKQGMKQNAMQSLMQLFQNFQQQQPNSWYNKKGFQSPYMDMAKSTMNAASKGATGGMF